MIKGNHRSDPGLMKRMIEAVSMKTNQLRNRFMIFVLLHRDESLLMGGMHAFLGGPRHRHLTSTSNDDVDHRNPIGESGESFIAYMNRESVVAPHQVFAYTQEDSEGDLTHDLLKVSEEEMELTDNEDRLEDGYNMMSLDEEDDDEEDDIDHAADVFIERFKRQMR